jgi:hypothetical protein
MLPVERLKNSSLQVLVVLLKFKIFAIKSALSSAAGATTVLVSLGLPLNRRIKRR